MTDNGVRAMTARYESTCAMAGCGALILRGHLLYRVAAHTLCHTCGRRYVDTLPMPPLAARPAD